MINLYKNHFKSNMNEIFAKHFIATNVANNILTLNKNFRNFLKN